MLRTKTVATEAFLSLKLEVLRRKKQGIGATAIVLFHTRYLKAGIFSDIET